MAGALCLDRDACEVCSAETCGWVKAVSTDGIGRVGERHVAWPQQGQSNSSRAEGCTHCSAHPCASRLASATTPPGKRHNPSRLRHRPLCPR
eukprot:6174083-Pleurochrysis_carterae.AAC.3